MFCSMLPRRSFWRSRSSAGIITLVGIPLLIWSSLLGVFGLAPTGTRCHGIPTSPCVVNQRPVSILGQVLWAYGGTRLRPVNISSNSPRPVRRNKRRIWRLASRATNGDPGAKFRGYRPLTATSNSVSWEFESGHSDPQFPPSKVWRSTAQGAAGESAICSASDGV